MEFGEVLAEIETAWFNGWWTRERTFADRLIETQTTRWFIVPALAVLAGGLFLVPRASDFNLMLVVIGAVRDSARNLDYVVITWLSTRPPGGVTIATKSLRSMVPARGFEPLTP